MVTTIDKLLRTSLYWLGYAMQFFRMFWSCNEYSNLAHFDQEGRGKISVLRYDVKTKTQRRQGQKSVMNREFLPEDRTINKN